MDKLKGHWPILILIAVAVAVTIAWAQQGSKAWHQKVYVSTSGSEAEADSLASDTVHIDVGASAGSAETDTYLILENSGDVGISVLSADDGTGTAFLQLGDDADTTSGGGSIIRWIESTVTLENYTGNTTGSITYSINDASDVLSIAKTSATYTVSAGATTFNATEPSATAGYSVTNLDTAELGYSQTSTVSRADFWITGDGEIEWGDTTADAGLYSPAADNVGTLSGDAFSISGNAAQISTTSGTCPATCGLGDICLDTDGDATTSCSGDECTVAFCTNSNTWYYPIDTTSCSAISIVVDPDEAGQRYVALIEWDDTNAEMRESSSSTLVDTWIAPKNITISDLYVLVDASPGTDPGWSFSIQDDGSNVLTCTLIDANTSCSDTGTANVAQGSKLQFRHSNGGSVAAVSELLASFCVQ